MKRHISLGILATLAVGFLAAGAAGQGVLVVVNNTEPVPLPRPIIRPRVQPPASYKIKELAVNARIVDQVARVQVSQSFVNTGSRQMEVTFVFPLPYDGAIDALTLLVDGKEYPCAIKQVADMSELMGGQMPAGGPGGMKPGFGEGKVLDQFANPDNPKAHLQGTGPEIWRQTRGRVRCYGMKGIAYLPCLKLGIAYYQLGQIDAALQAFQTEEQLGAIQASQSDFDDLENTIMLADLDRILRTWEGSEVQILKGRWGPFITDGDKNARIPKDREPDSFTLEECQALLDAAPERRGRKKAAKKKASKKKAARKKAARKKTGRKKASKKKAARKKAAVRSGS